MRLWDAVQCEPLSRATLDAGILAVAFAPNGGVVAGDLPGRQHVLNLAR